MSEPFLGEIRMFGFNWAPKNWAQCNGQIMGINQQQTLFSLLGTQFGGDGRTTFALPDFQSRAPMHSYPDMGYTQGVRGGYEQVTLTQEMMPTHTHTLKASVDQGGRNSLADSCVFHKGTEPNYHEPTKLVAMNAGTSTSVGSGQPHSNIQPSLGIGFCIALNGLYPSRN